MSARGPVIVIEGPDGAGKTTLARALQTWWTHVARRGAIAYLHQGPYRGDPLPETIRLLERPEHRGAVVCDRLHLGEQVYGPIFRGRDALGAAGRRLLERYLLARGARVILALPPREVARAAWAARQRAGKEMFADRFDEVYDGFVRIQTWLPAVGYDHTSGTGLAALAERARLWPSVAIKPQVRFILVGEAPGPGQTAPNAPPFCGRGGCSEWLAERLDEAGVDEAGLAWLNARNAAGGTTRPEALARLVAVNPAARVVALGRVAEAWCRRTVAPVATVPHPQFWKRFHHGQPYPLLEVLRARA